MQDSVYYFYRITHFFRRHRSASIAIAVAIGLIFVDYLFHEIIFPFYIQLIEKKLHVSTNAESISFDLGYLQVWLALIAMILGTLIIVISIASQSIPKLIDLYMQDGWSLFYIWFLMEASLHAMLLILYEEQGHLRLSSEILNVHFFFGGSLVIAFPYIFYILKRTKPNEVIKHIFDKTIKEIRFLSSNQGVILCHNHHLVEAFQFELFEALNQLADLTEYVTFKEPKADIIQKMSLCLREYLRNKPKMNRTFFEISPKIRSDISFKTMIDQFQQIEKNRIFYEQKCFRILSNIYILSLDRKDFELASLCTSRMTAIGQMAIEMEDDCVLDAILIRFNTTLRFAIKHGVKDNDARNLYNTVFYYGEFITYLTHHGKFEYVKRGMFYLRIYGTEIFKHGSKSAAMYFVVDVFAAEMKKILILIHQQGSSYTLQKELLVEFLQIDSPPDVAREDLDRGQLLNSGVRLLQIGLALFYQKNNLTEFVQSIINDILDDAEHLGKETFLLVIDKTCERLFVSGPFFWEDTDRGSLNIYYTPDKDQIKLFQSQLLQKYDQTHS